MGAIIFGDTSSNRIFEKGGVLMAYGTVATMASPVALTIFVRVSCSDSIPLRMNGDVGYNGICEGCPKFVSGILWFVKRC